MSRSCSWLEGVSAGASIGRTALPARLKIGQVWAGLSPARSSSGVASHPPASGEPSLFARRLTPHTSLCRGSLLVPRTEVRWRSPSSPGAALLRVGTGEVAARGSGVFTVTGKGERNWPVRAPGVHGPSGRILPSFCGWLGVTNRFIFCLLCSQ